MGYVDKQIAAAQKTLGDAASGKHLRDAIRKLQEKSQIRDTLQEARARGAIVAKRKTAKRTGSGAQAGFVESTRTYHATLRETRSTDGLFVLQWYNLRQWITTGGTVFEYADYDPSA